MEQSRFPKAAIPGPPQVAPAHALRDRAFDTSPSGILLCKSVLLAALSCLL
jgi:hypothetical protein